MRRMLLVIFLLIGTSVSAQPVSRYVVAWDVWSFVVAPCPDIGKVDEYGREQNFSGCLVLHGNYKFDRNMKKDFNEKKIAIAFVENAPSYDFSSQLRDFKLIQISGVDTTITKMPKRIAWLEAVYDGDADMDSVILIQYDKHK